MGGPKALASLPTGQGFLAAILAACDSADLPPPLVVIGAQAEAVLGAYASARARWLISPMWGTEDMFGSLRRGLRALADAMPEVLVWPVDCPRVPAQALRALIAAPSACHRAWVPTHQGQAGHPVRVAASLWRTWLADDGPPHLRAALAQAGADVARVEVGAPEVLENWNAPPHAGAPDPTA
jgi:CTP:molybdopterin cytidylyltransferase MocA